MNELLIYRIALGVAGICFAAFAVWTFRLSPENLSRFEPWPRAKLPGMVIGWIALFMLLRGRKSKTASYAVCQDCGCRWKV